MKNSIFRAVFTLTFFSVIDRALSFVLKIYLSNTLGAVGIGIYQVAISAFFVLLTITTSGIPLIVAKITAKNETLGAKSFGTATAALIIEIVAGIAICGACLIFFKPLSSLFATKNIMRLVILLLPALFFSGVYSAFRGNLWGKQCYAAVSLIEIAENLVRIALCVIMISLGLNKLNAAVISLSIACVISCAICVLVYVFKRGKLQNPKKYFAPLIKSALPITGVRVCESLVSSITSICVPFLFVTSGLSLTDAMYIFGSSVGMAFPLLLIPITVVNSLAYVMIPSLSSSLAEGKNSEINTHIEKSITFSVAIAALFIPAFWVLGKDIGVLFYGNALSGQFLSMSAWLLIPIAAESIVSSLMNSFDTEFMGFISFVIGSAVLFGILFAFYGRFSSGIIIISLCCGRLVSVVFDIIVIRHKTKMSLKFLKSLVICCVVVFPSALFTWGLYSLLNAMPLIVKLGLTCFFSVVFMLIFYRVFNLIPKVSNFAVFNKAKNKFLPPNKNVDTLENKKNITAIKAKIK